MRELFDTLSRLAASDATVLIQGETGTGKELVAQAIHEASPRADAPFAIVDCGALPENMLEAELFGHAKGAFTGATASRAGAIEAANGGTVFLDEVGELPLAMQPKLLRAIEARSVRRLGESQHRKVDVRFLSATHRDLREMVNAGGFREDLYFRLAVVPLAVPPLRTRLDDVPLLIERLLPPSAHALSEELAREASARPWFGNVRELRNFVDRAVILGTARARALDAPTPRASVPPPPPTESASERPEQPAYPVIPFERPFKDIREAWVSHLEREYIRELLARHGRDTAAVARAAGLERGYVYRLMKKHDL
jgi:transcriptional regulator with GAF, ATPase, and Fis domain